jgi:hypothetical protein
MSEHELTLIGPQSRSPSLSTPPDAAPGPNTDANHASAGRSLEELLAIEEYMPHYREEFVGDSVRPRQNSFVDADDWGGTGDLGFVVSESKDHIFLKSQGYR